MQKNPEVRINCFYIYGHNIFFFGPQLVGLYSGDPIIIQNSSVALKIMAVVQPFQSSQFILAGALRGAGDTFWPLVATFSVYCL